MKQKSAAELAEAVEAARDDVADAEMELRWAAAEDDKRKYELYQKAAVSFQPAEPAALVEYRRAQARLARLELQQAVAIRAELRGFDNVPVELKEVA